MFCVVYYILGCFFLNTLSAISSAIVLHINHFKGFTACAQSFRRRRRRATVLPADNTTCVTTTSHTDPTLVEVQATDKKSEGIENVVRNGLAAPIQHAFYSKDFPHVIDDATCETARYMSGARYRDESLWRKENDRKWERRAVLIDRVLLGIFLILTIVITFTCLTFISTNSVSFSSI